MDSKSAAPDIFRYLDYRRFLADWFAWRKEENPRFSHRLFARLAGQRSPSLLLSVIDRQRNLTPVTTVAFAQAIKLNDEQQAFFEALVDLDQGETDEQRNAAFERVSATRRFREARRIEGEAFRFLSHWYYPAIQELVKRPDFDPDPEWIARTLRPRIKASEARTALTELCSLGLLRVDAATGRMVQAEASLVTPHEVVGLAAHNYHREMISLAAESLANAAPGERHLLGLTVAIPAGLFPVLKAELNALQERLLHLCDSAEAAPDRVVQLNLNLFPLTTGGPPAPVTPRLPRAAAPLEQP
ncbi:MAG: hypothetical protein RL071_1355 [Pseudomonadota bacterium]|jgi:uncharacterized protein (TIGR02147 family)